MIKDRISLAERGLFTNVWYARRSCLPIWNVLYFQWIIFYLFIE